MKICLACMVEKPKEEFWKNNKTSDGLQAYCKNCLYKKQEKYRKEHPERFRESQRKYWKKHIDRKREINRGSYKRIKTVKQELIKHKDKFKGISPLVDEVIDFWISNLNKGRNK